MPPIESPTMHNVHHLSLILLLLLLGSLCTACVEHRGTADLAISDADRKRVHLFQDGKAIDAQAATFTRALPGEICVDAWYRDSEGHLYRASTHLLSPRPWWQRFPFDIGTDVLWPGQLRVEVNEQLQFKRMQELEPAYLDTLAEVHGYAIPAKK